MGIRIEFNPDLALRNINEFRQGRRLEEECTPENIEKDKTYPFLKQGQRNFWLEGEIPLVETDGNGELSRPLASVRIVEVTHFIQDGSVMTRGIYRVVEVFSLHDEKIHFESYARRK
jgi:hypothetical protein